MERLDESGWQNLEALERGRVLLDMRQVRDKLKIPAFIGLYEQGFATLQETGPGDSVHIFMITTAGKEALDAHRRGLS
ncbi:MAG: hypothetical protein GC204_12630 [Chloroflexi bacterium]|nr:hypothetical protein [Chloroflexota bacterium]